VRGEETVNRARRFSVIVASFNAPVTLERCLESLVEQVGEEGEIIVADCSDEDPRRSLRRALEGVQFLRFEKRLTIPEMRREALRRAAGEILLLTEARLVPSKTWAAELLRAHQNHPQSPAIGGPIDSVPRSAFDAAVFLCEYGWHMPPAADGECTELSGANLSYKRWALLECWDLVEAGAWEPFLHRRLEQKGYRLRRAGRAIVTYQNSLTVSQFLRQRFHYGRWFAAARVAGTGPLRRLAYGLVSPLLPLLLTCRLARVAANRGRSALLARALPWVLFSQTMWSAGEFCGYLAGKGASDREVF
jgi:GT2 family glycosyltransferase